MSTSIWNRKLDLLYLIFFVIHIPVMLVMDLADFYPAAIRPQFTISLREFYVNTYKDRFFIDPPSWFTGFIILELVYHLPLSFWAIPALLRDDPLVPLHLLIFAMVTGLTTYTSTLEMWSWESLSRDELNQLSALYLPYLGLAVLMGGDMFLRLRSRLSPKSKLQ